MPADRRSHHRAVLLVSLGAVALLAAACFMTIGARGSWSFVLPFRGTKLAGLAIVGCATAVATVLFQTATQNRILTPAAMGLDSLYVAIQTVLVFLFGAAFATRLDPRLAFLMQTFALVGAAILLFRLLFTGGRRSLELLLLAGIVFGVFCRSLSSLLQRVLEPSDFSVLQDMLFARFNAIDTTLLPIAAVAILICCALTWHSRHELDVMALGPDHAVNLGLDHDRQVTRMLALAAVLVAVSTALVGPILFFGLLVANLAYRLAPSEAHAHTLPTAVLIAIIALVGGQAVLEHVFGYDTALSIIIEFVGGIVFIALLLKGGRR